MKTPLITLIIYYFFGYTIYHSLRLPKKKNILISIIININLLLISIIIIIYLNWFFRGIFLGGLFLLFNFAILFLTKDLLEGQIGIIDFSWLSMMGICYGILIFCYEFEIFYCLNLPQNLNNEYYIKYIDELSFILNKAIDTILILGSMLAICMSIIWSGEIWRKNDKNNKNEYLATTKNSKKMAVAYFIVAISIALWICLPLFQNIQRLKEYLK